MKGCTSLGRFKIPWYFKGIFFVILLYLQLNLRLRHLRDFKCPGGMLSRIEEILQNVFFRAPFAQIGCVIDVCKDPILSENRLKGPLIAWLFDATLSYWGVQLLLLLICHHLIICF